jgi:Fe-S-cluster containining protein
MEEPRDHCIRCGECCLKGSPTLQLEDLNLVRKGLIGKKDLYTIRKGELVKDNINEGLVVTKTELVKVREREEEGEGCIFYDDPGKACTIYEHRPSQCAALKCWDTAEFLEVFQGPKLMRKQAIEERVLLGLIEEHERRCGYAPLEKLVEEIESKGEEAVEQVLDLLKFDYYLRPFVADKLGLNPEEMDFFFGRPLTETITMFGLQVVQEPDGSFTLTTINHGSPQSRKER